MRTLIYGAGTLGCLYAHRLFAAGQEVTLLARREYAFLRENGVMLVDESSGEQEHSQVPVVDALNQDDAYDLVIVLIRKNRLEPVFEHLGRCRRLGHILFMGNNALGRGAYVRHLPSERVLFGFPGAGGTRQEGVVRYVDREKPGGRRIPVTLGEQHGRNGERLEQVASLFEHSGVPVHRVDDITGWLRYHVALVSPLANALLLHGADNFALARDRDTLRMMVRACKEAGNVVRALGHEKRQPFKWNLFYWLPELVTAGMFSRLLGTRFAEIAYAQHALAARDEMQCLADELRTLAAQAGHPTPSLDLLREKAA